MLLVDIVMQYSGKLDPIWCSYFRIQCLILRASETRSEVVSQERSLRNVLKHLSVSFIADANSYVEVKVGFGCDW